jgi:hypothetical protein
MAWSVPLAFTGTTDLNVSFLRLNEKNEKEEVSL